MQKNFNQNSKSENRPKIAKYEKNIIKVKILNGPEIFFSINNDIDMQMSKLLTTRQQKLKDSFFNKLYVNLSIGDSVYFK